MRALPKAKLQLCSLSRTILLWRINGLKSTTGKGFMSIVEWKHSFRTLKNGQDIKERAENGKHGLIASAFSTPY
jgi:hypothetical protein